MHTSGCACLSAPSAVLRRSRAFLATSLRAVGKGSAALVQKLAALAANLVPRLSKDLPPSGFQAVLAQVHHLGSK